MSAMANVSAEILETAMRVITLPLTGRVARARASARRAVWGEATREGRPCDLPPPLAPPRKGEGKPVGASG
jgi:hypothetical protein